MSIGDVYSTSKELKVSVPQGSCAGPSLFNVYSSTVVNSIPKGISISGFADDHSLQKAFRAGDVSDEQKSVNEIESCLVKVGTWMSENRLKMNAQKTELIFLGSRQQLKKCVTSNINVIDDKVERTKVTKYLGTWLDENLSFAKHATMKCKAAMWNIHKIRNIRSYLDKSTCESLVASLVTPHLDYVNGLLIGAMDTVIGKYQRVQNIAAKLILNRSKTDSATKARYELHWLPIKARIKYKILLLVFKCLHNMAPKYLENLLVINNREGLARNLRSNDAVTLIVPHVKNKTFAARSFSVQGPIWWNGLPASLRNHTTLEHFKTGLKTHLFKIYY